MSRGLKALPLLVGSFGVIFGFWAGASVWTRAAAQVAVAPEPPLEHEYFQLTLSGDAVPGGGSRTGTATGTLSIDTGTYRIVWGFRFSGIDAPTGLHLHRGPVGQTGPSVVSLGPGTLIGGSGRTFSGSLDAALDVDRRLRSEILASPQDFYLQILTRSHPDGALRAQLRDSN